jgi:hypothetical protein
MPVRIAGPGASEREAGVVATRPQLSVQDKLSFRTVYRLRTCLTHFSLLDFEPY